MTPGRGAGSLLTRGVSSVTYRLRSSDSVGEGALPFRPEEVPGLPLLTVVPSMDELGL
jgi:hypothetical protein